MARSAQWILVLAMTGLALLPRGGFTPQHVAAATCQTFPETGKQVCDPFLTYWQQHGGLAQQGYPITDAFDETNLSDGKTYRTQYFERARFEYHPEIADPQYQVLLGLLGQEQYRTRYPVTPPLPFPGDPFNEPGVPRECATFAETGKTVCSRFLAYWRANGGLTQQGLPLTGVINEVNPTDGKTYPTQYFERARFEYHEEVREPQYRILLGLLGGEQFRARYPYGLPIAQDDFANPASGWSVGPQSGGTIDYAAGGLRLAVTQPNTTLVTTNSALPKLGNVVIGTEVRKRSGPDSDNFGFGLACRVQDAQNFYLLEISGSGLYGIVKVQAGRIMPLNISKGATSPAIHTGDALNQVVARCSGDKLTLTVNGQLVAEAQDTTFGTGQVGIVAGAYGQSGLTVVFDNLALYRP